MKLSLNGAGDGEAIVSVEGCKFVQLKLIMSMMMECAYLVSVEGCKFVQLKLKDSSVNLIPSEFQLKDVSLYN